MENGESWRRKSTPILALPCLATERPPGGYFHFVWLRSMAIASRLPSTIPRRYFGRETRQDIPTSVNSLEALWLRAGRRSDINIALPKRNTLSRGKFPSEDQGSKLLKSLPGAPDSANFSIVWRARVNFSNKKKRRRRKRKRAKDWPEIPV